MNEIRAETERGSTYILRAESQAETDYVRGDCLRLAADGNSRSLGEVAVLRSTMEVGQNMVMIVSTSHGQRTLVTSDVTVIKRLHE